MSDDTFSYKLCATTKGTNNEDAFEFDLNGEEYFMIRFDASSMYLSDSHGENTSLSQRANDFNIVNPLNKI